MNVLDWTIIGVYLAGMIVLGLWMGRLNRNERDYYVAGNSMPWWATGISVMATQCSTNSLLGAPAFVVLYGLVWMQYEMAVPLAMIFLIAVVIPVLYRLRLISIYEFVEQRFGVGTRTLLSVIYQLTRAFSTGVTIYGIAIVLQFCMGISFTQAVVLLAVVTIIYDMTGGLRAVMWSDVVQFVVLVIGMLVAGGILLSMVGGFEGLLEATPRERFRTLDFQGHGLGDGETFAFLPMMIGGLFLYVAYYGCDQAQVQRLFAAKSLKEARLGLFLNGLARFPLVATYCALGIGVAAYLQLDPGFWDLLPTRSDGEPEVNAILIAFVLEYFPHGLIGLFVIALFAAAMSSLDSTINSLSANSWSDIVARFFLRSKTTAPLWANRGLTLFWGVICTAFAFSVENIAPTILEAVNKISSLMNGPLLGTFLLAIFTVRTRGGPMVAGILAGFSVNVICWIWLPQVSWLWWNVIGTVATAGIAYGGSLLGAGKFGRSPALDGTPRQSGSSGRPGPVAGGRATALAVETGQPVLLAENEETVRRGTCFSRIETSEPMWSRVYWILGIFTVAIIGLLWAVGTLASG